ncbi:MAG: HepT-like ribonuclease domain-containing protein [Thermoplasmatota archaeon]
MNRELEYFLHEIVNEVSRIEEETKDLDEKDFLRRRGEMDGLTRRLHRVSRCVRALPHEFTVVHTEVPWARIASYASDIDDIETRLDPRAVWRALSSELPMMKSYLIRVLDELRYGGEEEE